MLQDSQEKQRSGFSISIVKPLKKISQYHSEEFFRFAFQ